MQAIYVTFKLDSFIISTNCILLDKLNVNHFGRWSTVHQAFLPVILDCYSPVYTCLFLLKAWCVAGNCFSLQREHDIAIKFFQRAIQVILFNGSDVLVF